MMNRCFVYIIIAMIMLFMEIWSLYLWLTKKYLPPKKITFSRFKKRVKEFYDYKRKISKNEIVLSDSMDIFLEEKKEKYGNFISGVIFIGMALFIYAIICSSILVVVLFFVPKHVILLCLFVLALEVLVFCKLCRKLSKSVIEWLDDFNSFLFDFRRKLSKEKAQKVDENRLYNTVVLWVALILSIVIVIALYTLLKKYDIDWRIILNLDYSHNPIIFIALVCIICLFFALLYFREIRMRKKGILFDTKLTPWENDIEKICSKLHIKNVDIKITDDTVKETVNSSIKKYEIPQICINGYFLNDLRNCYKRETFYYIVLFILGHELSHISSKDSLNRGKFKVILFYLIGVIIFLLILKEISLSFYGAISKALFLSIAAFGFFTYLFFYKAWSDERYWKQVYELRADRIGLQASNISLDIFKELMLYFQTRIEIEDGFHLMYETRIREIEKYNGIKWGIKDHLRYTWKFTWNLRFHKEWWL